MSYLRIIIFSVIIVLSICDKILCVCMRRKYIMLIFRFLCNGVCVCVRARARVCARVWYINAST